MRILNHPILEPLPADNTVHIWFDGRPLEAREGEPIAATLLAADISVFRYAEPGSHPRGLYCGMGHCMECRVRLVDGTDVRACLTPVRDGMRVYSRRPEENRHD